MAQKIKALSCILSVLMSFSLTHAMMEEIHFSNSNEEPDLEMGVVAKVASQPNAHPEPPTVLIEEPPQVTGCCISKHILLAALQGACITGIIFTKDMPFVPILTGLGEALFLGLQVHQIYEDCKSVPENKAIHAQFSAGLQEQPIAQSLTLSNQPVPFEVIESFDYALTRKTNTRIQELLYDTNILPTPPILKKRELLERKERFFTLLMCLKRNNCNLPKDVQQTLLAYIPELMYSTRRFASVIPYVKNNNAQKLAANCPMKWFNIHYNSIQDAAIKKHFATYTATVMTHIEMNRKRNLIASSGRVQYKIPDEQALASHLFQNYKEQITAPLQHKLLAVMSGTN